MPTKKRPASKTDQPFQKLYRAIAEYVEAHGGKVIIAEGIQIQEWPPYKENAFTVAVKCSGKKPNFPGYPKK